MKPTDLTAVIIQADYYNKFLEMFNGNQYLALTNLYIHMQYVAALVRKETPPPVPTTPIVEWFREDKGEAS